MDRFSENLRQRARLLGMSHAEVARRAGLTDRRFGNYVTGVREPDFATLIRIAATLETTPNELLGVEAEPIVDSAARRECVKLLRHIPDAQVDILVVQLRALAQHYKSTDEAGT